MIWWLGVAMQVYLGIGLAWAFFMFFLVLEMPHKKNMTFHDVLCAVGVGLLAVIFWPVLVAVEVFD